ncbi:MAG: hypothetical protein KUG79_19660 [Pseudomonadales bacterium]|nr:hypothetical protein [Pseudomonadales bacterium]
MALVIDPVDSFSSWNSSMEMPVVAIAIVGHRKLALRFTVNELRSGTIVLTTVGSEVDIDC